MLVDSVEGTDTYVQGTTYDTAGRPDVRTLGADVLRTDYNYFLWTDANGWGRLQKIMTGTPTDLDSLQDLRYTYDAVGNRLSYEITGGETITYTYDTANRMNSAGGVAYTWDDNGNLLADGASTYTFDSANRLTGVSSASGTYEFAYNGLGDRMRSMVDSVPTSYSLDLAAGLTQVLADGESTYLYGLGRIGEEGASGWQYHHGDALGSVRQLTDPSGAFSLVKSYAPFGELLNSAGSIETPYGFTGEWTHDYIGFLYLRSRYYSLKTGRFITRDLWPGSPLHPATLHRWIYVENNPVNSSDPFGLLPIKVWASAFITPSSINFPYIYLPRYWDPTYWDVVLNVPPGAIIPAVIGMVMVVTSIQVVFDPVQGYGMK